MDPFSSNVCIQKTTRRLPARDPPWLHESIICFDLPSFWVLKRAPTFISVQYAFAFISEIRENIWCSQGHLKVQEHYFSHSERRGPTGAAVANKYTHYIMVPNPWKTKEHQPYYPAATHTAADDRLERAPDAYLRSGRRWDILIIVPISVCKILEFPNLFLASISDVREIDWLSSVLSNLI